MHGGNHVGYLTQPKAGAHPTPFNAHFYGYTGFNESHATEKAAQSPMPAAWPAPIVSTGSLKSPIASRGEEAPQPAPFGTCSV